jgi:hypothetical protein
LAENSAGGALVCGQFAKFSTIRRRTVASGRDKSTYYAGYSFMFERASTPH